MPSRSSSFPKNSFCLASHSFLFSSFSYFLSSQTSRFFCNSSLCIDHALSRSVCTSSTTNWILLLSSREITVRFSLMNLRNALSVSDFDRSGLLFFLSDDFSVLLMSARNSDSEILNSGEEAKFTNLQSGRSYSPV